MGRFFLGAMLNLRVPASPDDIRVLRVISLYVIVLVCDCAKVLVRQAAVKMFLLQSNLGQQQVDCACWLTSLAKLVMLCATKLWTHLARPVFSMGLVVLSSGIPHCSAFPPMRSRSVG
jgi:hypothetical protein